MITRKDATDQTVLGGGSHQPCAVMGGEAAGEGGSAGRKGGAKPDLESSSKHEAGAKVLKGKKRKAPGVKAQIASGKKDGAISTDQEYEEEDEEEDEDEDSSRGGQRPQNRVDRGGLSAFPQSSGQKRAAAEMACNMLDLAKGDAAADTLLARGQLDIRRIVDGHVVSGGVSQELEANYTRHTRRMQFGVVANQLGLQRFQSMSVTQQSTVVEQTLSKVGSPEFLTIQFDGGVPSNFFCTPGLDVVKCSKAVLRPSIAKCASTIPRPSLDVLETMHLPMEDAEEMLEH